MKTILLLLASVLSVSAQSVDYQMLSQDINKLTRQVAESSREAQLKRLTQPTVYPAPAAISPQTLDFIRQKEAEYNKLLKKYNALLLTSLRQECSDKQAYFDASVDQWQTAVSLAFPCRSEKSHPINALVDKIYAEHEKRNDPIVYQADCPWVIYSEAAQQLGIKPLAEFK